MVQNPLPRHLGGARLPSITIMAMLFLQSHDADFGFWYEEIAGRLVDAVYMQLVFRANRTGYAWVRLRNAYERGLPIRQLLGTEDRSGRCRLDVAKFGAFRHVDILQLQGHRRRQRDDVRLG